MGYQTDFIGQFEFDKPLAEQDREFLTKFSQSRRMARNVDAKYGVEGEFYVDGDDYGDDNIINSNMPPKTQPGLWCQWTPSDDGKFLEWDGGEKFYDYIEWIEYIVNSLLPRLSQEYKLNGVVEWHGEDSDDIGQIEIKDNEVIVKEGRIVFDQPEASNGEVWTLINSAMTAAGYNHLGGGDGTFGFEDEYEKGDYKVKVGIKAEN